MAGGFFLDGDELQQLTARRMKSKQIAWLRAAGIPFRVNATGHPVVTRAAVEGRAPEPETRRTAWTPRVIGAH